MIPFLAAAALFAALDTPAPASPTPAAAVMVHTKNFVYIPALLTIPVGTKVTFVNDDESAHTVTAIDKTFDSGNMDKGAKWSYTFMKAGTYQYLCTYHTFMKAKVVVTDSPQ